MSDRMSPVRQVISRSGHGHHPEGQPQLARPSVIPYITRRRGETGDLALFLGVLPRLDGLRYLDEGWGDRDLRGVLWARCSQQLENGMPSGVPEFGDVHPARQREAMMRLRCQVCMGPADMTSLGYLFLVIQPDADSVEAGWPEGAVTTQPPLCLAHAKTAVEECHPLVREGHVALRVARPRLYGVLGTPYRFGTGGVEPVRTDGKDTQVTIPYGHERALWTLASQLVRRLCGVTRVDLDREIEASGMLDDRPAAGEHGFSPPPAATGGGSQRPDVAADAEHGQERGPGGVG
jgi:hypothetical protein